MSFITNDYILAGHPGQNKTVELIWQEYTWPGLCDFIKKYCKSCTVCMQAKPQQHKPYGLLKQLPIPECPWNLISMDFIETIPTSNGSDSILVIVDRLTKQGIFIPTTIHCTSEDLATLFILHVFSKHGVPEHITSDHSPKFVSVRGYFLYPILGMLSLYSLYISSMYHVYPTYPILHFSSLYHLSSWSLLSQSSSIVSIFVIIHTLWPISILAIFR